MSQETIQKAATKAATICNIREVKNRKFRMADRSLNEPFGGGAESALRTNRPSSCESLHLLARQERRRVDEEIILARPSNLIALLRVSFVFLYLSLVSAFAVLSRSTPANNLFKQQVRFDTTREGKCSYHACVR